MEDEVLGAKIKKHLDQLRKNGIGYLWYCITWILDKCIRTCVNRVTKNASLKDVIVIESHNDFDCNGGAFYDYLIANGYNEKYTIVWLLKNKLKKRLPKNVKAYKIYAPSIAKAYYISIAKFLLCDDMFTQKVKEDQKTIYCTHGGCTFKNVKGMLVVPEWIDHVLCSAKEYAPFMCENFSIPYPNDKMVYTGFRQIQKLKKN